MAVAAGQRLLEREREARGGRRGAALRAWQSSLDDALPLPSTVESKEKEEGEKQQQLLGRDQGSLWRWRQSPARVEVVVNLFEVRRELRKRGLISSFSSPSSRGKGRRGQRVEVSISSQRLSVSLLATIGEEKKDGEGEEKKRIDLLSGPLFKKIVVDGSTWHVSDDVLSVSLLKLSRRGSYASGERAAETWWRSVFEVEELEERENVEEVDGEEARPTATTTKTLVPSSPSSFLKLPEPLPASAPLCYYALPRDPDDEGIAGAERVVTRKKK